MPYSRPVGRPRKITSKVQNDLITALQSGSTYEIACSYAGISYGAFNNWMTRGRKEIDRMREEREKAFDMLVWSMKTRAPKVKKPGRKPKNAPVPSHTPPKKRLLPDKLPPEVIQKLRMSPSEAEFVKFFKAITTSNAVAAVGWLQIIDTAANNDPAWAAWMLMKRYPQEYGGQRSSSVEVKTAQGGGDVAAQETIIKIVYSDYQPSVSFVEENENISTPPDP